MKKKKGPRIGLQLYCLREDCAKDLAGTIEKVAKMGYEGVEFAGYFNHPAAEIKKMLKDNGIVAAGTHIPFETLLGDALKATVDFNLGMGNSLLIVPGLKEEHRSSLDAWKRTADLFSNISVKIGKQGLRTGYHNHIIEFAKMDGQVPYEVFLSSTLPEVVMQLDLGLAVEAGADPVGLLKKFPGRGLSIHAKEFSAKNPDAYLGDGDVAWPEVIRTCVSTAGTEWFIVEYERPKGTPAENVEKCLGNFKRILKTAGVLA